MVNTNADIAFAAVLIVIGVVMLYVIFRMIRSYYRQQREIEAQEARDSAARIEARRERQRIRLAEEDARIEADRRARAAEPRIPYLAPDGRLVLRPRSDLSRNPAPNLPVYRREDRRAGDTSTDTYYVPDFGSSAPAEPSKPDSSAIEPGGGSSGGAGASGSWESGSSSSSSSSDSGSSSSSSSDSGSSSSSSD